MVTGGGGSIGSEICARAVAFGASALLVIENSEPALHGVLNSPALLQAEAEVQGAIADIRDAERLGAVIAAFRPTYVFHAAALKQVPYLERDWAEGIKTNVFGSINVAAATVAAGARALVMISTDKAIEPVSQLGVTKRFAEMVAQAHDAEQAGTGSTRLIAVRFGNVLGSVGSVVPVVQGADRPRRPAHRHPSRDGALLHDRARGLRPRAHPPPPTPMRRAGRHGRAACGGLRPQDGPARPHPGTWPNG